MLLSGGNPQIAKADGDAPVQAYIAAMPGWKSDVGRRLDELIVRTVPDVSKCVLRRPRSRAGRSLAGHPRDSLTAAARSRAGRSRPGGFSQPSGLESAD